MNSAPAPAGNGLPATGVNDPALLIAKADTEAEPEFATNTNAVVLIGCVVMLFIPPPHPQSRHKRSVANVTAGNNRGGRGDSGPIVRCKSQFTRKRGDESSA